jgi:hypothetical protein
LSDESLRTERSSFAGLEATDLPRGPLSHFHQLDGWFQADPHNDCTTSGCHPTLPHHKRKETRAFLNMHATSMHCGVCHFDHPEGATELGWYALKTGNACETPPILQALEVLERSNEEINAHDSVRLVTLVNAAADASRQSPALRRLAEHFAAYRPGSDAFDKLMDRTRDVIPQRLRGEYGAKFARIAADGTPILAHPDSADFKKRFLGLPTGSDAALRNQLVSKIHTRRAENPLTCSDCHAASAAAIDLKRLGYPTSRINALNNTFIVGAIEHIAENRPFYLPRFLNTSTQPTSESSNSKRETSESIP